MGACGGKTPKFRHHSIEFRRRRFLDRCMEILRNQRNQSVMPDQQQEPLPINNLATLRTDKLVVLETSLWPPSASQKQLEFGTMALLPVPLHLRRVIAPILQVLDNLSATESQDITKQPDSNRAIAGLRMLPYSFQTTFPDPVHAVSYKKCQRWADSAV